MKKKMNIIINLFVHLQILMSCLIFFSCSSDNKAKLSEITAVRLNFHIPFNDMIRFRNMLIIKNRIFRNIVFGRYIKFKSV